MKFTSSSVLTLLVAAASAVDQDADAGLVSKIKMANTNLDVMNLLPSNQDWLFDFTQQSRTYTWSPGGVTNANAATFPAAVGHGLTMATLNLGACSALPAHLHPRAANFVVAVRGTTQTIMINENGAQTITQTLTPGQMTIFPAGSIHTMMNVGCEDAQLISALNSEDTGTLNVANAFFSLPENYVQAAMGQTVTVDNSTIPAFGTGAVTGIPSCVAACKAQAKRAVEDTRTFRGRNFRKWAEEQE